MNYPSSTSISIHLTVITRLRRRHLRLRHPILRRCRVKGILAETGRFDTICELNSSLNFGKDVYIEGIGSLHILSGVIVSCPMVDAQFCANASLSDGSIINVTALAGAPPPQTSGTPSGVQGSGGGHGGRGASCVTDNTKLPEDVWGGDAYSWSSLDEPKSYGSKGGTTSKEEDYGGGGGGRIEFEVESAIEVCGSLVADGGDGGVKGGGGSGGSIYIKAPRM
ncbi:hypothetical protein CK203_020878 [Vitis vinifera]|uniref:Uncharacterized protein n=1 Tax=Vitis vinifera TaxID=29760 RepID=A0A438II46_VITVI|nr:hypothetical protein CK203_020878 [Vitis vinifera]